MQFNSRLTWASGAALPPGSSHGFKMETALKELPAVFSVGTPRAHGTPRTGHDQPAWLCMLTAHAQWTTGWTSMVQNVI